MIQSLFWQAASRLIEAPLAFAQNTTQQIPGQTNPQVPGQTTSITLFDPLKGMTLLDLLNAIIDGLIALAVPVVIILIIIGAYYIIASGGNPGRRSKGKDYILWAVIGFAILILSKSVVLIIQEFLK